MDARDQEFRAKMQSLKALYHSRHYTQCARYAEQVLAETSEKVHPIHLAYLYFYSALAHDTLAREATLKNRDKELRLAGSHYEAAIAALSPNHFTATTTAQVQQHQASSPTDSLTSFTLTNSPTRDQRRSSSSFSSSSSTTRSYDSTGTNITASSPTSHSDSSNHTSTSYKHGRHFPFPCPPCEHDRNSKQDHPKDVVDDYNNTASPTVTIPWANAASCTQNPHLAIIDMPDDASLCEEDNGSVLAAHTASFVALLQGHLASVRKLATTPSGPHTLPCALYADKVPKLGRERDRDKARPGASDGGEDEAACRRRARMARVFRPRFDPEGVRRLCGDALDELAQR